MAFNINEKMMATDRAIITRNRQMSDLDRIDRYKFKPGMLHYVSEGQKLMLSTEPMKDLDGNDIFFIEMLSSLRLKQEMESYVAREGGDEYSMNGQLVSTVTDVAPFKVTSTQLVKGLNAEMVAGCYANVSATSNSISVRNVYGDITTNDAVIFSQKGKMIQNTPNGFRLVDHGGTYSNVGLEARDITLGGSKEATAKIEGTTNFSASIGRLEFYTDKWRCGIGNNTYEIVTVNDYGSGKGLDADTVDGKHVNDEVLDVNSLWTAKKCTASFAPSGYGFEANPATLSNNDCDSAWITGIYLGVNVLNGPAGETENCVLQTNASNDIYAQTITFKNSRVYKRVKSNNTWSGWEKLITSKNIFEDGLNVVMGTVAPVTDNENTYWYEVIS